MPTTPASATPATPAAGPDGPVLVVGASGNVGGAATRALLAVGRPVRPAGTDVAGLRRLFPQTRPVRLDLVDDATFAPALEGAGGLFLVRPPRIAAVTRTVNALVDAAAAARTPHVVFSSVAGADSRRLIPHHRIEAHLRESGLSWTVLRPGFFAQNLAGAYVDDIVRSDRIVLPAGRGRAAFLDTRDIGEAAAVVFGDPTAHRGAAYALTGPRALGFDEVAEILTRELGRRVRYEPTSAVRYTWHVLRQGLPLGQVAVQTVLHVGLRRGDAEAVDPTLARLLGRPPRSLEEYVRDHRTTWRPAAGTTARPATPTPADRGGRP